MSTTDLLRRGREAFARQRWADAHTSLSAADREAPLPPDDLERLATAAYLAGHDGDSADAWARAHQEYLSRGDVPRAVRCAFWLAHGLLTRGEQTRGGAWIARARRLLDEGGRDCVEEGYLLLPVALRHLDGGDPAAANATLHAAADIGERFRDPDLIAMACHGRGRALIRMGEIADGVRLLDEAMVAADAGDVSPVVVGEVYCSVISGCLEVFDVRRAREWTAALSRWCESQPELVVYSNQCLVRRAEIMQLRGEWPAALEAAQLACQRCLGGADQAAAGAAFYQLGEIHRLRGAFGEADEAYRQASRWGRTPQPGLALLRLAQGQIDAAEAALRGLVADAQGQRARSKSLPAYVEIMLAAGNVEAAAAAADELEGIAADLDAEYLRAVAGWATGASLLAGGDATSALAALRRAWTIWQGLEAPYEAARTRVLIARAARDVGDADTAELELDAARWTFRQLGAAAEVARIEPRADGGDGPCAGLTPREVEVLRLVATGKTNRAIAAELSISEKTVARHVSNIFTKLGLSTRAAATAYAYQHGLAQTPT